MIDAQNIHFLVDENPQEYDELKSRLFEEWKPFGPSEEKVTTSVAKALWKLRRVQRLRRTITGETPLPSKDN